MKLKDYSNMSDADFDKELISLKTKLAYVNAAYETAVKMVPVLLAALLVICVVTLIIE